MLFDKSVRNKKSVKSACGKGKKSVKSTCGKGKKSVKAAESYGWEVNSSDAWEAYDAACDVWGKDYVDDQIVSGLGTDELAEALAYMFRMHDYDPRYPEDDEDIEESVRAKRKKAVRASKLRKGRSKKSIKAARLTIDFGQYKPWSGAVDTWENLERFDKIGLLEQILDDTYYDENAGEAVLSETELNDLLWFEPETVYEWVGLYYDDNTGEVSDEPFDNDYDEDDEIEESVRVKKNKVTAARVPKSKKVYVVQEYVPDYGWEDVVEYDDTSSESLKDAKQTAKDYIDNGYNAKVITRTLDNPDYVEPESNITYDEAMAWVENSPYTAEKLGSWGDWRTTNLILKPEGDTLGKVQVFIRNGEGDDTIDDTVRVRNIRTNRTKQVYSIDELEKTVAKIMNS